MSHRNPSQKLLELIEKVRREESDERIKGLDSIVELIDKTAQTDACIRCQNAEWSFNWDREKGIWYFPQLMVCRAGIHLAPNEYQFGLERPTDFYCSSENTSARGASLPLDVVGTIAARNAATLAAMERAAHHQRTDQTPRA